MFNGFFFPRSADPAFDRHDLPHPESIPGPMDGCNMACFWWGVLCKIGIPIRIPVDPYESICNMALFLMGFLSSGFFGIHMDQQPGVLIHGQEPDSGDLTQGTELRFNMDNMKNIGTISNFLCLENGIFLCFHPTDRFCGLVHPRYVCGRLAPTYPIDVWLVVGPPLWKIWVRELGWLETQY